MIWLVDSRGMSTPISLFVKSRQSMCRVAESSSHMCYQKARYSWLQEFGSARSRISVMSVGKGITK